MNSEEIKTFIFDFEQVVSNETYFENLLIQEFPSEIIGEYYSSLVNLLRQKSRIKTGYAYFSSQDVRVYSNTIKIKNQIFETGKIINRSIKEMKSVFIITCTIGEEIEKSICKFFNEGNSLEGYVLDKMASELVELSADYLQLIIEKKAIDLGIGISNRFSPGYCGWTVSDQQKLFSLLPDNFCGIKLTSSSLMIPIKSISGIIAAGKKVLKKEYDCEICDEKFCYKKREQ